MSEGGNFYAGMAMEDQLPLGHQHIDYERQSCVHGLFTLLNSSRGLSIAAMLPSTLVIGLNQ